ncbi:MAG: hypothetical protein LIO69_09045 [Oscillospiraceae bacterium]|nr:hypothetical protein [Oscillospiraceae bacterium]
MENNNRINVICEIYKNSPLAVAVTDADGILEWQNNSFASLCPDYAQHTDRYFCPPNSCKTIFCEKSVLKVTASEISDENILLSASEVEADNLFKCEYSANCLKEIIAAEYYSLYNIAQINDSIYSNLLSLDNVDTNLIRDMVNSLNSIDTYLGTMISGNLIIQQISDRAVFTALVNLSDCVKEIFSLVSTGFCDDLRHFNIQNSVNPDIYTLCDNDVLEVVCAYFMVAVLSRPAKTISINVSLTAESNSEAVLDVTCKYTHSAAGNSPMFPSLGVSFKYNNRPNSFALLLEKLLSAGALSVAAELDNEPLNLHIVFPLCDNDIGVRQRTADCTLQSRFSPIRLILSRFGSFPEYMYNK